MRALLINRHSHHRISLVTPEITSLLIITFLRTRTLHDKVRLKVSAFLIKNVHHQQVFRRTQY